MIEYGKTKKVSFLFNNDSPHENLFEGLKEKGPYDLNKRNFEALELIFSSPYFRKDAKIDTFLKNLKNTLLNLFKLKNVNITPLYYRQERELYDKELIQLPDSPNTKKILLHYHTKYDERYIGLYYKIKRFYLQNGIATQGLLEENFSTRYFYINNVASGIYAKMGGRPWAASTKISTSTKEHTIYIGFDVSRQRVGRTDYASPGCVVAYNDDGQYLSHSSHNIPITHEYMTEDQAQSLLEEVIDVIYGKHGKEPDNIIFMRDGDISDSEILGFNNFVKKRDLNLLILEVRKAGNIPILQEKEGNYTIANSGVYMSINYTKRGRLFDLFIQTLGPEMDFPTIPKAVKITPRVMGAISIDKEDLSRQILVLSYLNWSYLRGRTKLPITVHYAHKAALLMGKGISPQRINDTELWMI